MTPSVYAFLAGVLVLFDSICVMAISMASVIIYVRDYHHASWLIRGPIFLVILGSMLVAVDRLGGLDHIRGSLLHVFMWRSILDAGLAMLSTYRAMYKNHNMILHA